MFGSLFGGKLIIFGRRKCLLLFNMVGILTIFLTVFENVWLIIFGRFLFGFCGGVFTVAGPKMIEETVPAHLLAIFGPVTNMAINLGSMIAILLAVGLPDAGSSEEYGDNFWRFIFGFPILFQIGSICAFLFIFKEDSIKFLVQQGNHEDALVMIKKVYHPTENHTAILE
jgi:MFS family permease